MSTTSRASAWRSSARARRRSRPGRRSGRRSRACMSSSVRPDGCCHISTARSRAASVALYAHVPAIQRLARHGVYAMREVLAAGMTHHRRLLGLVELVARAQLRVQVRDPVMRAQLTPRYDIGCKRAMLSNDWYPMLAAPNTELVTAPIAEVRERSIVTADGVRAADRLDHPRDRLSPHGPSDRLPAQGRRRAAARRRLEGQPAGLPRHRDQRLSEPLPALRAQPQPRPLVDRLHAGESDPLRPAGDRAAAPR